MSPSTRLFLRIPAVSTKLKVLPSMVTIVSIASRVVPGISLTRALSSPAKRFSRLDFPTFGRPTMATRTASWRPASSSP
ncbi:MAG: hypothetical protein BWY99_02277 [Synergistetes bacterium ADurb.BinA166]|nr:MAG: hypothetical protein BWY99_02277 [Synergistetes bacterium ADurb.BinA166]